MRNFIKHSIKSSLHIYSINTDNMFISETHIIYDHQHVKLTYAYHLLYKSIKTLENPPKMCLKANLYNYR